MNHIFPDRGCILFCLLIGILATGTCGAMEEHEEAVLRFDDKLTLSALLDTTVARQPGVGVLIAGKQTADAELTYGRHWFPESPEIAGFRLSDRQFDDIGAYENEVALSFPLWLPGEKSAQNQLGQAALMAFNSRQAEFRWVVSGILRQQLWDLVRTRRQWEVAQEQEQNLAEVFEQVTLLAEAGDLARADQLVTLQELAIWKAETMTLEAEYQDAVRQYRAFTGSLDVPVDISEKISEQQEITESHPALLHALDRLAEEAAKTERVRQGNASRPSVQVFWRGYGGDRTSPDINALGLGLAIPIGGSPARGPEIARANEKLATAEAEILETRRRLDLQLHEARHMLKLTGMQLENSNAMVEAANERQRLDELAFELGEFGVREWLRRLSEMKRIQRSHELLLMQQGEAIASYNQAVGETL